MSTHLIIGTGAVGTALAGHLVREGHTVRAVNRSGHRGALPHDVTLVPGDVRDAAFAAEAMAGADVVHQVAQPAYHRWAQEFPGLQRAVLDGAAHAGAAVVLADNLYLYGPPGGGTLTDDSPENPTTRKGRVRQEMAHEALAAHDEGRVRVALTRPANYVGATYALFREMVLDRVAAGKPARVLGRTDQPHSFSYVPDVARAMAAVAGSDAAWGRAWIAPALEPITQDELVSRLWAALGAPGEASTQAMPRGLMRTMGLFSPALRESVEMLYEFEEPFIVEAKDMERDLGVAASTWDGAIDAMARDVSARNHA